MDRYDVIIIGTGAGGGTLARHLATSDKRILLLERGGWLPRELDNWLTASVFVDNRYVSPDTWYDRDGTAFQPGVHYYVGGATKLYGAALYRLREEDSGSSVTRTGSHRPGPSRTTTRAVLHAGRAALPGARRTRRGPDRAARERAVPTPAGVSRAADPAACGRSRRRRASPFPCAVRDHARRVEPGLFDVHPLCHLRRLPLPRPREVGRGGARRPPRARAPERDAPDRGEGDAARDGPGGDVGHRGGRRLRRLRGALHGRPRRRLVRCGEQRKAALAVGERPAPERSRERLRPGRPQLHVPRLDRRARPLP